MCGSRASIASSFSTVGKASAVMRVLRTHWRDEVREIKVVAQPNKEEYFIDIEDDEYTMRRPHWRITKCPLECSRQSWKRAKVTSMESKAKCLDYLKCHFMRSSIHALSSSEADEALVQCVDFLEWDEWEDTWQDRETYRRETYRLQAIAAETGKVKQGRRGKKRSLEESD